MCSMSIPSLLYMPWNLSEKYQHKISVIYIADKNCCYLYAWLSSTNKISHSLKLPFVKMLLDERKDNLFLCHHRFMIPPGDSPTNGYSVLVKWPHSVTAKSLCYLFAELMCHCLLIKRQTTTLLEQNHCVDFCSYVGFSSFILMFATPTCSFELQGSNIPLIRFMWQNCLHF